MAKNPLRKNAAEKTKDRDAILVATDSFVVERDGDSFPFYKGVTRIRAGHDLVKGNEDRFEAADENVHYDFESATSAPNEKR